MKFHTHEKKFCYIFFTHIVKLDQIHFVIIVSCLSICLMHPVTWWVAKEYEVDKSNNKNGEAYDLFPLQSMVYLICSSLWVAPPQQTLSSQLPSPVSSVKASEILKPCHVQLSQTWELPSIRVTRLLLVHLFSKRVLVEEQDDQNKERSFHMDNSVFNVLRLVLYFKRSRLVFLPATTVLSQHRLVLASAGESPFINRGFL